MPTKLPPVENEPDLNKPDLYDVRRRSKPRQSPLILRMLQGFAGSLSGGMLLIGMVAGVGLWRSGEDFVNGIRSAFTPAEAVEEVDVQTVVVQQIRGASELTTAVFTMEVVVPTSSTRTIANYEVGKTTLIYIAHGEVRAGVDLSTIEPTDIQDTGDTLRIMLPPPTIIDSKIDVNQSQVFDYDRGFLGMGPDRAPELQDQAQEVALQRMILAACEQSILQEASERAELVVGQLLQTTDYEQIVVASQPSPNTACAGAGAGTVQ